MEEGIEMRENGGKVEREDIEGCKAVQQELDDDGLPKRTGTVWTASAHIITAVIGSGVLSLPWAMSLLGWIAGPASLVIFSVITYYTSTMLADCYRTPGPVSGKRNYTYMDAVKANLGGTQIWLCGLCQFANLFGVSIGYTITASISAAAVAKSNCFHKYGHGADCQVSGTMFMAAFGLVQMFLSQLPNFHTLSWLSVVAAVMSLVYSSTAVGLSAARVISDKTVKGTLTGLEVGVDIDSAQKVWKTFQALGDIAFAYSYSMLLIEIQDTLRSPPAENKLMKKASFIGVSTTTLFYILSGCLGYAAFGNRAPGNILTGFGFYEPFWLVDLANICIVVHLVGAFQVFAQPLFAAVETRIARRFPNWKMLTREYPLIATQCFRFDINLFRLVWRTVYVIICTLLAMLVPLFNDVLAFLGAIGFWPLTVYLPIEMYIAQKKIASFSAKGIILRGLCLLCFLVSLAAACGSIQGVLASLRENKPFQSKW